MDGLVKCDELGNAETSKDVSTRMMNEITKIAKKVEKKGGRNIFVVSHGGAIGEFLSGFLDVSNYNIDNASVTHVSCNNGKLSVHKVGDTSYVEKGKK